MTLGRTSSNAIKIKTDGGLRAVECACCGGVCAPLFETPMEVFTYGDSNDLWSKEKLDEWWSKPFTVNIDLSIAGRSYSLSVRVPTTNCKYDSGIAFVQDFIEDFQEYEIDNGDYLNTYSFHATLIARFESYKYIRENDSDLYGIQSHSLYEGDLGQSHFSLFGAYSESSEKPGSESFFGDFIYLYPNAFGTPPFSEDGSFGQFTPPIKKIPIPAGGELGDFNFYEGRLLLSESGSTPRYPTTQITIIRG